MPATPRTYPRPPTEPCPAGCPGNVQLIVNGPPKPDDKGKARLTVIEHLVHQVDGRQPTQIGGPGTSERLQSDEKPFVVRAKATEEWRPLRLDAGGFWPGLIVLSNPAPAWQRYPTPEEKAEAAAAVLELSNGLLVRPGRTLKCELAQEVNVRCKKGECFYSLTLIPG